MKNLRHRSLKMNAIYRITKVGGHDSRLEILVQKINVKKSDFNSFFLEMKSDHIPICTVE